MSGRFPGLPEGPRGALWRQDGLGVLAEAKRRGEALFREL
jgi:hypothetical protein